MKPQPTRNLLFFRYFLPSGAIFHVFFALPGFFPHSAQLTPESSALLGPMLNRRLGNRGLRGQVGNTGTT